MNISLWLNNKKYKLNLAEKIDNGILVSMGRNKYHVSVEFLGDGEALLNVNGKIYDIIINSNSRSFSVYVNGKSFEIEKKSASQILKGKGDRLRKRDIKTFMPGRIIKILVEEGDIVDEGQAVLILEAMKMQNEIKSPQSGKISRIGPEAGESVETGALLFSVE